MRVRCALCSYRNRRKFIVRCAEWKAGVACVLLQSILIRIIIIAQCQQTVKHKRNYTFITDNEKHSSFSILVHVIATYYYTYYAHNTHPANDQRFIIYRINALNVGTFMFCIHIAHTTTIHNNNATHRSVTASL